jgi:putative membrane protein
MEVWTMSEEEPQLASNQEQDEKPRDLRLPAALVRTALSSEQTLMSWIRTSLSLFALGFSITQFFYYLEQQEQGVQLSKSPRRMGIALVCVGIVVLLLAMVEHVLRLRKMKRVGLPADALSFLPFGSAVALLLIGIAVFISIIMNWSL